MSAEDRLRDMMRAAHTEARATEAEWSGFVGGARRRLYARRAALLTGAAALVIVGAFAAIALTGDDPAPAPLPPIDRPSDSPTLSPTPPAKPGSVEIPDFEAEQWFVADEVLYWGTTSLGPGEIPRDLADDDPVSELAAFWLRTLVAVLPGPVEETGGSTAIPKGTELLHVGRAGAVLEVDLSSEFESGGGSLSMQLRVAQIVYTGTQFDGIESVRILIEGERVDAIGGEGIVV
jgi:hypothetical protein